ncbi:MAG: hypothetical protein HEEMFOPI_01829 [Holosporales bacterium]
MKKLFLVFTFCVSIVFAADNNTQLAYLIHTEPFNLQDSRLSDFKVMCEEIGKIVKEKSGVEHTCFLSYAWPENQDCPLRSWFEAIDKTLKSAGIYTTYDWNDFNTKVSALQDRAETASKILIILTPDYKKKCDKGTTLRGEVKTAFLKCISRRTLLQLAGTFEQSFPIEDVRGLYTPSDELLHMMTSSNYREQKETDAPHMDKFYTVMCQFLNPTKAWSLLTNVDRAYYKNCTDVINCFLTKSQLNTIEQVNDEKQIVAVKNVFSKVTQIHADITIQTKGDFEAKVVTQEGGDCRVEISGTDQVEAKGDVVLASVFQVGEKTSYTYSGQAEIRSSGDIFLGAVDQKGRSTQTFVKGMVNVTAEGDVSCFNVTQSSLSSSGFMKRLKRK